YSVRQSAAAPENDVERIEPALGLLAERYREGRSGIVLERAAGGYAFRAAREAAEACSRLFERAGERGLSPAAREGCGAGALTGGARDAGDRRLHRARVASGDRSDPGRGGGFDRRVPRG